VEVHERASAGDFPKLSLWHSRCIAQGSLDKKANGNVAGSGAQDHTLERPAADVFFLPFYREVNECNRPKER
jgi:hypothetical protein